MKRSPIRKNRSKPRPGRVKGVAMVKLRQDAWLLHAGNCLFCGEPVSFELMELAHKHAKRRHGDGIENVAPSHAICHRLSHAGGKPCPSKVK